MLWIHEREAANIFLHLLPLFGRIDIQTPLKTTREHDVLLRSHALPQFCGDCEAPFGVDVIEVSAFE
jgi:hypothetical protein